MKDTLKELATQPRSVIKLAHQITWTLSQGRDQLATPSLSPAEKDWLKANDFDYTYNRKIYEYEIDLT